MLCNFWQPNRTLAYSIHRTSRILLMGEPIRCSVFPNSRRSGQGGRATKWGWYKSLYRAKSTSPVIRLIIISGLAFTVGNVVWPIWDEPKIFYVPLAVFLLSCVLFVRSHTPPNTISKLLLNYLTLLACGNVVKQIFYTEKISQINDYVLGGLLTLWLFYKLYKNMKWETKK